MLIDLLILVVVVAIVVWLILLIPMVAPFRNIIIGVAILILVAAALSTLFGIDILGRMRSLGR